tara:strand:+ start:942 stop:1064 length:123 start_codon:yes stop_codon:yes gene_type:complete
VCAYRADPAVSPAVSQQFHGQFQEIFFVDFRKKEFLFFWN